MQVSQAIVDEAFEWHIDSRTPISQNIFRFGSDAWAALVRLAREHYQLGRIDDLDEDDFYLLESDAGELAMFEGREVMLDTPSPIFTTEAGFEVFVRSGLGVKRVEVFGPMPDYGKILETA
jgi:hypothetical protein